MRSKEFTFEALAADLEEIHRKVRLKQLAAWTNAAYEEIQRRMREQEISDAFAHLIKLMDVPTPGDASLLPVFSMIRQAQEEFDALRKVQP